MLVTLAEKADQLVLGEVGIDERVGDHLEGGVPDGEPGKLPAVGHGQDVAGMEVGPVVVRMVAVGGGRGLVGVAGHPAGHVVEIELLAPDEARGGLSHHVPRLGRELAGEARVEGVCLRDPLREHPVEAGAEGLLGCCRGVGPEPQRDHGLPAGGEVERVDGGGLGAGAGRVDGGPVATHEPVVKGVLHVGLAVGRAEEPRRVGLVVGEDPLASVPGVEAEAAERGVLGDHAAGGGGDPRLAPGRLLARAPRPGVAKPEGRQEPEPGRLGAGVGGRDPDADVGRGGLGVFHLHVEEPVVGEHARVEQFVFTVGVAAAGVAGHQLGIGEGPLRIAVERREVAGRGRGVEVVVQLLDVLAMVALRVREAEEPLLENFVAAIPEGQREGEAALVVGDPEQPVLAPAIGPGPGLVVRKRPPDVAIGGVVLAHRAPLPLRQVRPPELPGTRLTARLGELP